VWILQSLRANGACFFFTWRQELAIAWEFFQVEYRRQLGMDTGN
jgi:hypothetical protein